MAGRIALDILVHVGVTRLRGAWCFLQEGKAPTSSGRAGDDGPASFPITQAAFNGSGSLARPVGNLSPVLFRCSQM